MMKLVLLAKQWSGRAKGITKTSLLCKEIPSKPLKHKINPWKPGKSHGHHFDMTAVWSIKWSRVHFGMCATVVTSFSHVRYGCVMESFDTLWSHGHVFFPAASYFHDRVSFFSVWILDVYRYANKREHFREGHVSLSDMCWTLTLQVHVSYALFFVSIFRNKNLNLDTCVTLFFLQCVRHLFGVHSLETKKYAIDSPWKLVNMWSSKFYSLEYNLLIVIANCHHTLSKLHAT